jgi:hypothetical protein
MRRKRCAAGSGKTQAAGRARPYCAIICRSVVAPLSEPERSFIDRIPGLWAAIAAGEFLATWRSGYAAVCKTVYPGSIPGVASKNSCDFKGVYRDWLERIQNASSELSANSAPSSIQKSIQAIWGDLFVLGCPAPFASPNQLVHRWRKNALKCITHNDQMVLPVR